MVNLKQISELVNGTLQGEPSLPISGINALEKAGPGEITFLAKKEFDRRRIRAAALIVSRDNPIEYPNLVRVDEPYQAFAIMLAFFHPRKKFCPDVDPRAAIAASAVLEENVTVGPFSFVGENSRIGRNSEIHAGVVIYDGVRIGSDCLIYASVVIRENVTIGNGVIIQPGAVIGADGFGFTRQADGAPIKIPQVGRVVIGDHCEIGANTCIDRSTIEETELQEGVKLDNLVQIGHNVTIGRHSAISAQTGIAGSTRIGAGVIMGGQVGVADHLHIADGVMVAAKSGISGSIKEKMIVSGNPHQEISRWRRSYALLRHLDEYRERIKSLEEKIKELEAKK